jgi:predicted TIM-barrel fold metal-dependent hydrolase
MSAAQQAHSTPTMRISAIDAHMHVLRRDAPLVAQRHSKPARDATVDELVAVLDAHGVSHALLTAPSFYGADNSLLLEALDAYPLRLRGTVILNPDVDERALAKLARRGVVGVRLNWVRRDTLPDLASGGYPELLARVRALGWHVEVYLEGPKLARVLPQLRGAGVTVVLDHFAAPDPAQGVRDPGFVEALRGVRAGDTYVKLSAPYRLGGADPQPYVDALLAAGGPAQLVWASDWPFVGHEEAVRYRACVDALEAWIPAAATRHVVRVETPARLFGFDRPRGSIAEPCEEEDR